MFYHPRMTSDMLINDGIGTSKEPRHSAPGALYAGIALTIVPILALFGSEPTLKLGHWIMFFFGVALLIYSRRREVRADATISARNSVG